MAYGGDFVQDFSKCNCSKSIESIPSKNSIGILKRDINTQNVAKTINLFSLKKAKKLISRSKTDKRNSHSLETSFFAISSYVGFSEKSICFGSIGLPNCAGIATFVQGGFQSNAILFKISANATVQNQ